MKIKAFEVSVNVEVKVGEMEISEKELNKLLKKIRTTCTTRVIHDFKEKASEAIKEAAPQA